MGSRVGLLVAAWAAAGVGGYEVRLDEYANALLPGHGQDSHLEFPSLPNLPFTVDGNRLSDGVSSVSPLTATAPAFPIHYGAVSNAHVGRSELAAAKRQSEVEQGVAAVGDGDYVREGRVDRLEESPSGYGPPPTRAFIVNASLRWNPSSFAIQARETYRIDVFGPQRWVDGFIKIDADGYPAHYDAISQCWVAAGLCRSYLGSRLRLVDANWFSLVCAVGDYVWKLQEDEIAPTFLPLREAEVSQSLFFVGHHLEFTALHDGELVCFANDADHLYWNNRGQLAVNVTRTSWPPTRRSNLEADLAGRAIPP